MRLAPLFAAGFASAVLASTAVAQQEIKLGHVGEPGSLFQLSTEEFARAANEKLGDKAKVVVFGSSQLGSDEELLQKLLLGTADMALPSALRHEQATISLVMDSRDAHEGCSAFLEKRKPRFDGA